jgi:hypothetical protein
MPASDTGIGGGVDLEEPRGGIDRAPLAPTYVQAYDPMAPAIGWAALGAAAVALFGVFALISGVMDTTPAILQKLDSYRGSQGFIALGAGAVLVIICFVIGMLAGKAGSSRVR